MGGIGGVARMGVGAKSGAARTGVGAIAWLNSSVVGSRRAEASMVGQSEAVDDTKVSGGAVCRSSLLLAAQP